MLRYSAIYDLCIIFLLQFWLIVLLRIEKWTNTVFSIASTTSCNNVVYNIKVPAKFLKWGINRTDNTICFLILDLSENWFSNNSRSLFMKYYTHFYMENSICKSWFTFHTRKFDKYIIQIIKFYNYFILVKLKVKKYLIICHYDFVILLDYKWKMILKPKKDETFFTKCHTFFCVSSCRFIALNIYDLIMRKHLFRNDQSHPGPLSISLYRCPIWKRQHCRYWGSSGGGAGRQLRWRRGTAARALFCFGRVVNQSGWGALRFDHFERGALYNFNRTLLTSKFVQLYN